MVKSLVRNDYNVYAYNNCEDIWSLISNSRMDLFLVKLNFLVVRKMKARRLKLYFANNYLHYLTS